ncbi:hypothetical protein [Limnohabitans sp.]|uniref:hypothetical protein n=1 Tax=Limnohabitans sp. TaxID=1907725 RepID=UPI00286F8C14|nr:hypothetical protein [Limnohabitans sp.]
MFSLNHFVFDLIAAAFLFGCVYACWALLGLIASAMKLTRLQLLGLGWLTGFLR